jgi:outer membrane protein assembly factor BamE (lipoprotein component of BamABCDE complex)
VQALVGNPTARGSFDDNTWLYISELTKPVIAGTQNINDQNVVVMTFDQKGILRSITKRGAGDAKDVAIASGATPSPGSNASLFQQLLGNVGRFSTVPTQSGGNGGQAPSGAGPTSQGSY